MTTVFETLERLRARTAGWLPQLLTRVFVGYFFLETGWGKVHNLAAMTERFQEWGIPAPAFNAALSGYTELIGGALLIVGLATRLISVPLLINMVVAIVTVKLKKVEGANDFFELDEPLYGLAFLWLIYSGAGALSLDALLSPRLLARFRKTPAALPLP